MSYYNPKQSASDKSNKSFLEKYTKTGKIDEAVVVSSLYRLHIAFGGKKTDPGDPLPGVTTEIALLKKFTTAAKITLYADFNNRVGSDNAILKSRQSFPKGVPDSRSGQSQAFSLYAAMNRRETGFFNSFNEGLSELTSDSVTARFEFKKFLDRLVGQNQGFKIPQNLLFGEDKINMNEEAFANTWNALIDYKYVIGGTEIDGVQQFYDYLSGTGRIKGELFGESFTINDDFFVSDDDIKEARERTQARQKSIQEAALKEQKALFNEQFYLMSRMEELAKYNSKRQYKNFSYIRRFDNSSNLENSIYFYKDQGLLFDMSPIQLSALVPYFKLYLVYDNGTELSSVLMPLQGSRLNLEEILNSKSNDKAVGFKSFDWSYQGKYLETANDIIDCSLKLFGSNLEALNSIVGRIDGIERDIRFEDLVTREKAISFRAICGWAVPYGVDDKIISKELRRSINKSLITLELGIPKFHNFDFQQDGRFDLEIKYAGRIAQEMQDFNLLENQETTKDTALSEFDLEILKKFTKIGSKGPNDKTILSDRDIELFIDVKFKDSATSPIAIKKRFITLMGGERNLTKAINLANRLLAKKTVTVRSNDAFSNILKQIELRNSVFYFSLNSNELDVYLTNIRNQKNILAQGTPLQRELARRKKETEKKAAREKEELGAIGALEAQKKKRQEFDKKIAELQKEMRDIIEQNRRTGGQASTESVAREIERTVREFAGAPTREQEAALIKADKFLKETAAKTVAKTNVNESPLKELKNTGIPNLFDNKTLNERIDGIIKDEKQPPDQNFNLPFFFFGDLVESILGIAGKEKLDRKRLRILLGGLIYRDPKNNTKQKPSYSYVPLVDVPISIRNFSAFVHNNYIQKPVLNMDLNSFLTDAFNSLVKPIFSGRDAIFDLPDFAKRDTAVSRRFFTTDKKIRYGLVDPTSLRSAAVKNSQENFGGTTNFAFFNGNQSNYSQEDLNRAEDSQKGIMHLSLGQNRGLVKKASFSKKDFKFARTGRLVADIAGNESVIDKIREPYDVYVELYGNNILVNGSKFFISPSMPGVSLKGETSKEKAKKSVASRLGLGGYYVVVSTENSISDRGFFTNVMGRFNDYADATEDAARIFAQGTPAEVAAASAGNLSKQAVKKVAKP